MLEHKGYFGAIEADEGFFGDYALHKPSKRPAYRKSVGVPLSSSRILRRS